MMYNPRTMEDMTYRLVRAVGHTIHVISTDRRLRLLILAGSILGLASCATGPKATSLPVLTPISSPSGLYTLRPMLGGWSRNIESSSVGPDTDLALVHEEASVGVEIYVERGRANSLDDYVLRRRARINQIAEVLTFEETRTMQPEHEFRTISVSKYGIRYAPDEGWSWVISGVVRGATMTIEILAIGGHSPQNRLLVEDLIYGLRFVGDEEEIN